MGSIYLLHCLSTNLLKLGWAGNFGQRLSQIRRGNADSISIVWVVPGTLPDERQMHRDLKKHHKEFLAHDEFYYDGPEVREAISSLLPVRIESFESPENIGVPLMEPERL